jgi:magnesium-transporting ATPase (P-type)
MNWPHLIVGVIWGMLSAQFFLQGLLGTANFCVGLIGFLKGAVSKKTSAMIMGTALSHLVLWSALLIAGFWLVKFLFHQSSAENVVYWAVVGLSALFMFPQLPPKIRNTWRWAMIPRAFEKDRLTEMIERAKQATQETRMRRAPRD